MSDESPHVLIVDDREENLYVLRHTLERAGFRVTPASTGKEALELSRQLPEVVLLDIRLPDILGYEVCRRLKANPQTRHIPVLQLSSSFTTAESKLYALESGADAYLTLPVDPLVLAATVRSLVRLHEAEQQAHNAAEQWTASFDALREGVAIVKQGIVERCNRAMTLLVGRTYSGIEGSSLDELLSEHFQTPPLLPGKTPRVVRLGHHFFELSTTPLPTNGTMEGHIFLVAEVTAQKQAEEALLLNERLAATGRLAHIIAHEINNPLEGITNLIYLAQGSASIDEETRAYLATAAGEVERVSQIARQILSFNRDTRQAVSVPVGELVRDVLALSTRAAAEKSLQVQSDVAGDFRVLGFPARLRQVFSNIIRNAIEAAPAGSLLRVRIRHTRLRTQGQQKERAVRITIADRGGGIPQEVRSRIFEPFFTTKGEKGSGVGLWLAASIIEEHGGKIQVRSSDDAELCGTVISVLIPAG